MKTNWQIKKLDDVCDFFNGLWIGKEPPYINVGVIRNTNFTKDGNLDDSDIAYLDVEKKKFEKRRLAYGDIILEKSGGGPKQPVGRVIIFDKKDGDFSFSNFTSAVRVKNPKELDFNFLHKFLFYSYISGMTEGMQSNSTGIRNLDSNLYKEIEISFPVLTEQKRIVKVLDEVFVKLEIAKNNAEKNLRNSKTLFESYLQNIFINKDKNWEEKRLGDVCDTGAGGTPLKAHKDYYENGNIPWLRSGEVCQKEIIESELFITEKGLKNSSARMFPVNTVLVAMYGATAGQTGILRFESTTNQAVCGILPNENFLPEYVYYYFSAKKADLVKQAVGGAQPNISQIKIKNTFIPVLAVVEQKTIVKKLNELSNQTKKLEEIYKKKLADLEELKKSVLKKAFTGML